MSVSRRKTLLAMAVAVAMAFTLPAHGASAKVAHPSPDAAQRAEALNAATAGATLVIGARGNAVVRAQVLMDRAWFSPGEIDGRFSSNMHRALKGYQQSAGLVVSGKIDRATWQALAVSDAQPFATYTVTDADVAGPYAPIPAAIMERAKLKSLGYTSTAEALGERFHMSPKLLRELNPRLLRVGREIVVANVGAGRGDALAAPRGASIRIDKSERMLYALDGAGKPVAGFPISIGGPLDPLPVGRMKITNEVTNPTFTYDPSLLKDAPRGSVKTEIAAGPNNPVGNVWLGLSKPHWGIHGTPNPERMGRAETNGCIHMTNWDAKRLSMIAKAGFVVDVRE